jgi:ribokinase
VKPARTGRAYIIVGGGQNMIVVDPGANSMLGEEDVLRSLPRGGALTASLEVPPSAVRAALEAFNGIRVLNPAPATPEARELARLADVITPNEVKALQLTGASSPAEAAESLLELAPAVIITLGERGPWWPRGAGAR